VSQLLIIELFVHSGHDYLFEELELDFVIMMVHLPVISVVHAPKYLDLQVSPIMALNDEYKVHIQIATFYLRLFDKDHNSILLLAENSNPKAFFQLFLELFL
jgi:hypothetical protein